MKILNLLLESGAGTEATKQQTEWYTYVILGVLLVGMVLMFILPQRKQKKQAQEMMNSLKVGSVVTTIGGIIGTVKELSKDEFVLETGADDNTKSTMRFTKQAIYMVHPEGTKTDGNNKEEEPVYNEIK